MLLIAQKVIATCKFTFILTDLVKFLALGFIAAQWLLSIMAKSHFSLGACYPLGVLGKNNIENNSIKSKEENNTNTLKAHD